jgi:tetratricopeptide (TPR) repeat protein
VAADDQPTDELDVQDGGRAPAGLAEPPLVASGRRLGGRYTLERKLGHGGMAVVWLATDERLDRQVAVKVLSDTLISEHDYRGRFRREAQVAANLQHPNLVPVYDYDAGERPYLVMEYVEGGDLAVAQKTGTVPPVDQLAEELLSALEHIHRAGILHRDIKPGNVLIDGYGHARLSDFGIARPLEADTLTRTGQVIGTERYLAPEVKRGEPASERSDLYALGVLLDEFCGEGPVAMLTHRLRDEDPAARPASAADALAQLAGSAPLGEPTQPYAFEDRPRPAPAAFEPQRTASRSHGRRNRFLALGAIGLAVVAVAVALVAGSGGGGGSGVQGSGNGDAQKPRSGGGSAPAATADAPATTAEATTEATTATEETTTTTEGTATPEPDTTDGTALNNQGFALIGQGDYAGAIPVLQKSVEALRDSGDETNYNYALYNLATAYLGAGQPEEAIPLLKERMQFDDGQLDAVQQKLDEAYQAAGQEPPPEGE